MRFQSFVTRAGRESVGAIAGDRLVDLTPRLDPAHGGLSPIRRLLLADGGSLPTSIDDFGDLESIPLASVGMRSLVPDPSKIVAAPVNYVDHQSEMNEDAHTDVLGVFLKAPSSVIPDGGTVSLPYLDRRFDQEGEPALVIGRTARHVAKDDAVDHIAGYTCLLDLTMRGGEDRSTRKSFRHLYSCRPI